VCKPNSTEEVAAILKYCHEQFIGVVPQAGNTGVVGGSVPVRDEVIVSLERLNDVISFDKENGILQCGAGCILQNLQQQVASWDHLMPIDLGSKGTCQIGGNVSTNAG
jgi:D-2-hydroxyglutarate dehydrogenase